MKLRHVNTTDIVDAIRDLNVAHRDHRAALATAALVRPVAIKEDVWDLSKPTAGLTIGVSVCISRFVHRDLLSWVRGAR